MMAWYEDLRNLTEKTGAERTAFVRKHARSVSAGSHAAPSFSSDGLEEDEADKQPYAANATAMNQDTLEPPTKRPSPGGRFPSDIDVNRGLTAPLSPSSSADNRDGSVAADSPDANRNLANHGQFDGIDRKDYTVPTTAAAVAPSALDPATAPHQSGTGTRDVSGASHNVYGGYAYKDPQIGGTAPDQMSGPYPHPANTQKNGTIVHNAHQNSAMQLHQISQAYEMPSSRSPPNQSSVFSPAQPGDASHDYTPALAAAGGAAGGAGAYALYQNHEQQQQASPPNNINTPSHQKSLSTDRPLQADYPSPSPSPSPSPAGVYPDPVNDYTSPVSTSPPAATPGAPLTPLPAPDNPTPAQEPTLPDLSSAAFAGTTPRADADAESGSSTVPPPEATLFPGPPDQADTSSLASIDDLTPMPQGQGQVVGQGVGRGEQIKEGSYFKIPDLPSATPTPTPAPVSAPARRSTTSSVSQLHVPGEFPGTPAEGA